jgi:hypothetical protein
MKLTIIAPIISVLFGCGQSNQQQMPDSFFHRIVNDFSRNSYFILLNINVSDTSSSEYLIENDDLFFFFHQTQGWSESDYKTKVLPFLAGKEKIKISKSDLDLYHFSSVKPSINIEKDSEQGKDFFVSKYFSNRVLKESLSDEERNSIIKVLYSWKIASRLDDESGYLMITSNE